VLKKKSLKFMAVLALSLMVAATGCAKAPASGDKPADKAAAKAFKPEKPITLVVPMAAGGATDLLARAVEKVWSKYVPQPLTVVNKPGASGVDGSLFVSRSNPDGTTLVIGYGGGSPDLVTPQLSNVQYDPFKDLVPVSRLSIASVVVAVPEKSEFKSIKDVIAWAKKENKPVTAAVSTNASANDFVMKGIGKVAGIQVTPIPHAGGAQAITTLVGGQTMMGGAHPSELMSQIKANRVKVIAVATPERDPILPDVPTLKEEGINFSTWGSPKGVAAPKGTPKEIVDYYSDVFKKISEDADFKKAMADMGQPVQYQNAEDFSKFMRTAYDDYTKLINELGFEKAK
jgi:tripartite-type tricarboxylate transporter receptor subunit TctC